VYFTQTCDYYLGPLVSVVDVSGQRGFSFRLADTDLRVLPLLKFVTIGNQIFKVASAETWNSLPEDFVLCPSYIS